MSRYFNSFFISFVLYASILGLILYEVKDENFSDKKSPDVSRVCFSIINNQPTPQNEEPKQESKVEKKIVKEEVKKRVPKKEIVVEKKLEEIHDETKEEEIAKVEEEQAEKQNAQQMVNTKIQETLERDMLKAKQDIFLAYLVEKINANKSYPNSARRREIQGNVEMKFHILQNGHVKEISLVSGKHIFKESAFEAIEKSFPINVDKTLFSFPKEFKVTLAYILK